MYVCVVLQRSKIVAPTRPALCRIWFTVSRTSSSPATEVAIWWLATTWRSRYGTFGTMRANRAKRTPFTPIWPTRCMSSMRMTRCRTSSNATGVITTGKRNVWGALGFFRGSLIRLVPWGMGLHAGCGVWSVYVYGYRWIIFIEHKSFSKSRIKLVKCAVRTLPVHVKILHARTQTQTLDYRSVFVSK